MRLKGKARRFGDNVNTDYIIAEHYKNRSTDIHEIAKFVFADFAPDFGKRVQPGDILVAGRNFGCGSAREAAPHVLKISGIACVVASSFARIFFRNAINIGLPLMECDTTEIEEDDDMLVDPAAGTVEDVTRSLTRTATPLQGVMADILASGGIAAYLKEHGTLILPSARRG